MMLSRRQFVRSTAGAVSAAAISQPALSQHYPARPVRIIVPFAPGGPNDLAARLVAQKLSERLGGQCVVENIAGAGGNIGMGRAARAAPDGYTMLAAAPSIVVNPGLYGTVPYDLARDFVPLTILATAPTVLAVHPSIPARTMDELVALLRANPGKHSYASPGVGTPPHLVGELFRLSLGLDLVHVAFNSGGLAIGSAVAGHTPISFGALPPAVPHVREGRLRALAITGERRSPALPDISTSGEAGHPTVTGDIWTAMLVPAGTPGEISSRLQSEIVAVLSLQDVRERLSSLGYEPVGNTAEECAAQLRTEAAKWGSVIRQSGIRAE